MFRKSKNTPIKTPKNISNFGKRINLDHSKKIKKISKKSKKLRNEKSQQN